MPALTSKQEAFAQAVASGLSHSDAYRSAYTVRKNTLPKTVNQQASRLMSDHNISARVAQLRIPIVAKVGMTLENHLLTLAELRDEAKSANQFSAAISAEVARGKASGVAVDKSEVNHKGNFIVQISEVDSRL
jgi:phage terminase small subunit